MSREVMLDTHCHIDEYRDPGAEVRALAGRPVAAVAVTSTPRAFEALRKQFVGDRQLRVALGIHPLRASTLTEVDWRIFERSVTDAKYIGG